MQTGVAAMLERRKKGAHVVHRQQGVGTMKHTRESRRGAEQLVMAA